LPGLDVEISASQIREQLQAARGGAKPGCDALPPAVCGYIAQHSLYGS
jgi:nicotinic acid mononucleotide adenylyltransferase